MSENKMLRRIFGPEREKMQQEGGENFIMESFIIGSVHQILLKRINDGGWDET
jgi:hypothetical protein